MPGAAVTMQLCRLGTPSISARQSKQTPIRQKGARLAPVTGVSRVEVSPASSIAAAAEAPSGTRMSRPSTVTSTVGPLASGRLRNIEARGGKQGQLGGEHAGGDHRGEGVGVGASEGDAAVAIRGKGPGELLA